MTHYTVWRIMPDGILGQTHKHFHSLGRARAAAHFYATPYNGACVQDNRTGKIVFRVPRAIPATNKE